MLIFLSSGAVQFFPISPFLSVFPAICTLLKTNEYRQLECKGCPFGKQVNNPVERNAFKRLQHYWQALPVE